MAGRLRSGLASFSWRLLVELRFCEAEFEAGGVAAAAGVVAVCGIPVDDDDDRKGY